jgi:hypothetical protein
MDRKLLTFGIALVIIAIVVAPVAAKLPAKCPLPPNNPFNIIWTLYQDLQNQINDLTTKINALTSSVSSLATRVTILENKPTVHFGEPQFIDVDKDIGVYNAAGPATDGIVTVRCSGFLGASHIAGREDFNGGTKYIVYADSPVPVDQYGHGESVSFSLPVIKGHNWGIEWDGCDAGIGIAFWPLSA